MSYGRLFVINVMENAMRLICISNKKCKYRGVDELKFMNDEYFSWDVTYFLNGYLRIYLSFIYNHLILYFVI